MRKLHSHYQQGRAFEKNKSLKDRKAKGVFYTPYDIVEQMVASTLNSVDLVSDPYVKLLDLSCGAGYFLLQAFELLQQSFQLSFDDILVRHPELQNNLTYDKIGKFIVENNLWGADIDPQAVSLVQAALNEAAGEVCQSNILCADSLLAGLETEEHSDFFGNSFDYIIGNPPYLGHKGVPKAYKQRLYQHYSEVYKDKSDLYYCFFKRGMELLKPSGILCYITSRTFLEGPSAAGLRNYLSAFEVEELIDFGDYRVFEDAGIAVCIIKLLKKPKTEAVKVKKLNGISGNFDCFEIESSMLGAEGWLLLEPEKRKVFQYIDSQSTHMLETIFDSSQGIITGCDKAFVLSMEETQQRNIEKSLLKKWIKNSQVDKHHIQATDKVLLYTDLIETPENFPNAMTHVEVYRDKLQQRRECQKGYRPWFKLQWGRTITSFETPKIVYPFKAAENRFAVDYEGCFCSADVYSLTLKEGYQGSFSLEYLAALLNSKLVEFYFKAFAKKISPSLYDYYPNKVLKIKLKLDSINENIEKMAIKLQDCQNAAERACILQAIDREIYNMYDLSKEQIETIEK